MPGPEAKFQGLRAKWRASLANRHFAIYEPSHGLATFTPMLNARHFGLFGVHIKRSQLLRLAPLLGCCLAP